MIEVLDNSIIYIVSLYVDTGGPKTLHQLANCLSMRGANVSVMYIEDGVIQHRGEVLYDWCVARVTSTIDDKESNILIVPEISVNELNKYRKIRKVIFWLSLDFFLRKNPFWCAFSKLKQWNISLLFLPAAWIFYKNRIKDKVRIGQLDYSTVIHLYNCSYVENYLIEKGVKENKKHYLCGPIQLDYVVDKEGIAVKENIVALNMIKTKVNTLLVDLIRRKIEKEDNRISVVMIHDMPHDYVIEIFRKAKVYVDLGTFPGPERLPREAVVCGCNLLVSQRGSAGNEDDYPLPSEFKVNVDYSSISTITNQIRRMVDCYYEDFSKFDSMRKKVAEQEVLFTKDIKEIFFNENN